ERGWLAADSFAIEDPAGDGEDVPAALGSTCIGRNHTSRRPDARVFANATMKRAASNRSGTAACASILEMRAFAYKIVTPPTWPSFSSMPGIIRGRNRGGFDPITRNAICHAMATDRKP